MTKYCVCVTKANRNCGFENTRVCVDRQVSLLCCVCRCIMFVCEHRDDQMHKRDLWWAVMSWDVRVRVQNSLYTVQCAWSPLRSCTLCEEYSAGLRVGCLKWACKMDYLVAGERMGPSSRSRRVHTKNLPGCEGTGHPEGCAACRNPALSQGPVLMFTLSPKQVRKDNQ